MTPPAPVPVSVVAFDLDGTLYFGDTVAGGAVEIVEYLCGLDVTVLFFTNNSAKTRAQVVEKLVRMGLPATRGNTYNSGSAAGTYLGERGWNRVAVLGTDGLRAELVSAGLTLTADATYADALVVGLIPDFDFDERPPLLDSLVSRTPIVACNMDMTYPVEGGERRPGCGAIVHAVEAWCGRSVEEVVGKPGTYMFSVLCREHDVTPAHVLVVGDNADSDIAMALAAGAPSVLIGAEATPTERGKVTAVSGLPELLLIMKSGALRLEGNRK